LSSTKPVTAAALATLWERGRLDLDDPVASHIPEFGVHGKEGITLRHLLTHTAGIRMLDVGWPERSWEEILARICAMRPEARWVRPNPGGNGYGPMRELGRYYEMLLARGTGNGKRILSPQTVEAMTARHRTGMMDATFKHVLDWGLGFIVNSASDSTGHRAETVPYGYGHHASPRTFGHSGYRSSVGFADPERGLAVAL